MSYFVERTLILDMNILLWWNAIQYTHSIVEKYQTTNNQIVDDLNLLIQR